MSTNSCVIVKVRPSEIGKTIKFNKKMVNIPIIDWKCIDSKTNEVWRDETAKRPCIKGVKLVSPYIAIYCHWDGDLEGVGKSLKTNFQTYEEALNLVSGGFCSAIDTELKQYARRENEKWEDIKPMQFDTLEECINTLGQSYTYFFDDNSDWVVKEGDSFEKY